MSLRARLTQRWADDERFRFLVVGAYNTAFGFLLFPILYLLLQRRLHYLVILVITHAIAVANSFIAHRRFAFRAVGPVLPQLFRYKVGYVGALALSIGGMYLLVSRLGLSPLLAQPILMVLSIVLTYLWHSRVSFRR